MRGVRAGVRARGTVRGAGCLLYKHIHSPGEPREAIRAQGCGGWMIKPVAAANVVDLSFLLSSQAVLPVATYSIC